MVAPLPETGEEPTCSLWLMAWTGRVPGAARRSSVLSGVADGAAALAEVRIGVGQFQGMAGTIEQDGITSGLFPGSRACPAYGRPPVRRRTNPRTVLFLPHPELHLRGFVRIGERQIGVTNPVRGPGASCGIGKPAGPGLTTFTDGDGGRRTGTFVDGGEPCRGSAASWGRTRCRRAGPRNGRGVDQPARRDAQHERVRARYNFGARRPPTDRQVSGAARMIEVTADPDGELAYCYNTEVADMRLDLWGGMASARAEQTTRSPTATRTSSTPGCRIKRACRAPVVAC